MGTGEIIAVSVLGVWAFFAAVLLIRNRKKGKKTGCSGCSGNCHECGKSGVFVPETRQKTEIDENFTKNNRE